MKENIEISVIMSTCNVDEEFLKLAIISILNQTIKNIELIIVNDGGQNLKTIQEFKDNRIIIINHQDTKGLPFSLNEAISISKGKYIARMDSDDISKLDRLQIQKKYLDKNPHIDVCSTFYKKFYEENDFIINPFYNCKYIGAQLFFRNVIAHPSIMLRKNFLIENNLRYSQEYRYSQDFELWTRCLKKGNIGLIPKLGLYYRIHENQIRSSKKEMQKSLYNSVLIRNLKELELDESNLIYIEMLNGNNEDIDFEKLFNFINIAIEKNKFFKIYDEKAFKNILYNKCFKLILRKKKFKFLTKKTGHKILFCKLNYIQLFIFLYFNMKMKLAYNYDNTLKKVKKILLEMR